MSDPKPVRYVATETVYVDGVIYKPNEPFVTAAPKGSTWRAIDADEKAQLEAAAPIKDDIDYTKLNPTELRRCCS
jgi:hypothetical protein